MRSERRNDLVRILREGHATSQEQIAAALREGGHHVTQATVSRDLRAIGATKVMIGGEMVYRLPDQIPRAPGGDLMVRNLLRTIEEFAVDIQPASSLVVLSTAPGHASAVARAIDLAGVEEVVGTVAGDDTIFVATGGPEQARVLARAWKDGQAIGSASADRRTEIGSASADRRTEIGSAIADRRTGSARRARTGTERSSM